MVDFKWQISKIKHKGLLTRDNGQQAKSEGPEKQSEGVVTTRLIPVS
ncbi:MAG TPA: hypothetical protein VL523_04450 [Terriglobia bacterium]|nr:hypothetical protein [Terriglobia bacterium]